MNRNGIAFRAALVGWVAAVIMPQASAFGALIVDQALTDTSQIRSAANNPYFGAGNTVDLGAVNLSYGTPVGSATLLGIGFHDLDLQSNPRTGAGIPVAYALPGVTMDFTFDGGADMPGSRNLTSVSLTGADAAVGNQVALGNRYISATTDHRPNLLTFHGAQGDQPVYVQLVGGQHGWNGDTTVYVNGDGVTEGSGTLVGTWNSNKTDRTAGLAAFEATTKANGDLTLEVRSGFYSGLAAVLVQAQQAPPGPLVRNGVPNPDYPTFQLWFDASDAATLTAAGGKVSQWNDKAGVPNNASQGTASRQPTLVAGAVNGKSAVRFDGLPGVDGDVLSGTADVGAGKTIYFVARDNATTATIGGVFTHDTGPNGVWSESGARYVVDWPGGGSGNSANTTDPINTFSIIEAKYDNTNGTISIFQNGLGGELLTTPRGVGGSAPFYLGSRTHAGEPDYSRYFKGDLAEVLVYEGILTGKDEEAVGNYLAAKYALSNALTFKTTNPYAQRVLKDGPVAYYRFERADGGVILDSAGSDVAQNGTLVGTGALVSDTPGTIGGLSAQSLATGYADMGAAGDLTVDGGTYGKAFTLEAWVKKAANFGGSPNYKRIIDHVGAGTADGFGLDMTDTHVRMLGSTLYEVAYSTLDDFDWKYVVATSDGAGTGRIFVNGRFVGQGSFAASNAYAGPFRVGASSTGGDRFSGNIDEAAMYGAALSPARILEHYVASTISGPGGQTQSFRRGENAYAGVTDARLVAGQYANNNYGATPDLLGGGKDGGGITERGVIRFDLGSLAAGGTHAVGDGTLMFTVSLNQNYNGRELGLYLMNPADAGWIEGVHNNQAASTGEVTWNARNHNLAAWAGGPGGGTPGLLLDSVVYNGEPLVYFDIPQGVLNDWINDPLANAGLLLADVNEGTVNGLQRVFFWQSDAPVIENRPVLVFNTAVPEPATLALLGLAVAGLAGYARRRRS